MDSVPVVGVKQNATSRVVAIHKYGKWTSLCLGNTVHPISMVWVIDLACLNRVGYYIAAAGQEYHKLRSDF